MVAVAISHQVKGGETNDFSDPNKPFDNKKSLVVCPSSVVGHWRSEIQRFFPSKEIFACFDFTGSVKARRASWRRRIHNSNIVVTSYSVLRSDVNLLENVSWD